MTDSNTPTVVQTRTEFSPFQVEQKPLFQDYTGYWVVAEYAPFKACCAERIIGYHLFQNDQEGFDPASLTEAKRAKYNQLNTREQAFYTASKQVELLNQIFRAGFSIGQGMVEGYHTGIRSQAQDIPVALSMDELTVISFLLRAYKDNMAEITIEGDLDTKLLKKIDTIAAAYKNL